MPFGAAVLELRIRRAAVQAALRHRGRVVWSAGTSFRSVADLGDAIARLASETPVVPRRLRVELAPDAVQLRTISDLPPVRPRALEALVAHQSSRFFRRNGAPLVTDATWLPAPRGELRRARAAAVEEPVVAAIAAGARAAGLVLDAIAVADAGAPLELLPPAERLARGRRRRRSAVRLAILAAGLWLAAATAYVARLAVENRRVAARLAQLEEPLRAVVAARQELRTAAATLETVRAAESRRGWALATLAAAAEALGDSAAIVSLTVSSPPGPLSAMRQGETQREPADQGSSGVLAVLARRAGPVVARLERSPALGRVRVDGPITRELLAGVEWERFTVVFGPPQGEKPR
jgi:hypothetical protein